MKFNAGLSLSLALFMALAISLMLIVASASSLTSTWAVGNNPILIGANQVLTAQVSGGVLPYTFNFLVYNPSNVLSFNSLQILKKQPDVLLQYSNGVLVGYNSTNSLIPFDNGNALETAVNKLQSGANIYLKGETYDLNNQNIDLLGLSNIGIYGSGKYKTAIKSEIYPDYYIIEIGMNTTVADLEIVAGTPGQYQYPYGVENSSYNVSIGTSYLRNVYISGDTDGVFITAGADYINGNLIVQNLTDSTLLEDVVVNCENPIVGGIYFYDSNLISSGTSSVDSAQKTARGMSISAQNVYFINGSITTNGPDQFGIESGPSFTANVLVYGSKINNLPSATGSVYSIYINSARSSNVLTNATTSYNALEAVGTVSNTLGAYGSYSYDRSPLTPPGGPGTKTTTFSYTQSAPTGTWNAILIVKDSTGNIIVTDPTYNVIPGGTIFSIEQGHTAVINNPGASGGNAPYSYQWLYSPPPCNAYAPIASRNPPDLNATKTTYYFNTNNLTALGISCFVLQVTDASSAAANSPPVGVDVLQGTPTVIISDDPLSALPFGIGIGLTVGIVFGMRKNKGDKLGRRTKPNPKK